MAAGGTKTALLKLGWTSGPFRYRAVLNGDQKATPKLDFVELNYIGK